MRLGMSLAPAQYMACVLCEAPIPHENRDSQCPCALAERLAEYLRKYGHCPECRYRTPSIELNSDDLFECTKCHTQYTTAQVLPGLGETKDWPDAILWGDEDRQVKKVPERGRGKFPLRERMEDLQRRIKKEKRRKRK